jgi:hypothetical protein
MLNFYRTKSALQIKLKKPTVKDDYIEKEGAVFLEFAKGEDKKFDWKNKITFALSTSDYPILFTALEGIKSKGNLPKDKDGKDEMNIIHKYNDKTKKLVLKKGEYGYFLTVIQDKDFISVSMSYGDLLMLYHFLVTIGFDIIRI